MRAHVGVHHGSQPQSDESLQGMQYDISCIKPSEATSAIHYQLLLIIKSTTWRKYASVLTSYYFNNKAKAKSKPKWHTP